MSFNSIKRYVLFVIVSGILVLISSSLLLSNAIAAQVQLLNDNNTADSMSTLTQAGEVYGAALTPDATMYPVRVLSVEFALFRLPDSAASVDVRVCIYAMKNGVPDTQLGCSVSTTVTTFYPTFVSISLPSEIILNSPDSFMAAVEYITGAVGTTPSTLRDSNTSIPQGKNFFSIDGGSTWYEHYDFWTEPDQVGYNMIRATVDTNYLPIETINLPLVLNNWQPFPPDTPVLNAISNPNGERSYTVNWNAVTGVTSYTLEEAGDGAFTNPEIAYSGTDTSTSISGQYKGTYYYRVKAVNQYGSSDWSNIQSTQVTQDKPPYDWTLLQTGTTNRLFAVHFIDAQTGWVLASDWKVLHTTDGGQNWEILSSLTTKSRSDLFFIDQNNGWIVGNDALIMSTTDGGKTWEEQISPVSDDYNFRTVQFVDSTHGWIAARKVWMDPDPPINQRFYGHILRTTDGGQTWHSADYFSTYSADDLYFINQSEGWLLSTTFDPTWIDWWKAVYHTSDGGTTWVRQSSSLTETDLADIFFIDSSNGWVVGDDDWLDGPIWHTANGSTWSDANIGINGDQYGVQFVGSSDGWIRSLGAIWHTENGVDTWTTQTTEPGCADFNDFHFVSTGQGWVVGDNGVVCKYP